MGIFRRLISSKHDSSSYCGSCGVLVGEDAQTDGNDVLYCKDCFDLADSHVEDGDPDDPNCTACGVDCSVVEASFVMGGERFCTECAMARGWDEAHDPADPLETCDGCGDKGSGDSFFEGPDGALYYCPSCADDMGIE